MSLRDYFAVKASTWALYSSDAEYGSPDFEEVSERCYEFADAMIVARSRNRKLHNDDYSVNNFASLMKDKLAKKRDEGRGGWERPDECSLEHLVSLLKESVDKGDPVDVGNFAMMIQQRGGRTS